MENVNLIIATNSNKTCIKEFLPDLLQRYTNANQNILTELLGSYLVNPSCSAIYNVLADCWQTQRLMFTLVINPFMALYPRSLIISRQSRNELFRLHGHGLSLLNPAVHQWVNRFFGIRQKLVAQWNYNFIGG